MATSKGFRKDFFRERAYLPANLEKNIPMFQRHPIQNDHVMFITTNIRHRRKIFADPARAREAVEILYRVQELHPFFLHGFVIMPDHCHFLLKVPEGGSISRVMNRFKMGVSHSLNIGPIWQSRFFVTLPDSPRSILHYIHMNPVRAGLADNPEDYPWSSACGKWDREELQDW